MIRQQHQFKLQKQVTDKKQTMQGTSNKFRSTSIRGRSGKLQGGKQTKSAALQIIPGEVVFKDIQVNQFYQITIQIRNLTHKAKRIRIQQCSNPNFSILYTMQPQIAPGLSMTAKIKYLCKQLKNQTELIRVLCDEGTVIELPARVYKTQSQIVFQPFINLGFVKAGKQHQQKINLKNIGKAPGKIQFSHNHGPILVVEPSSVTIPQKQQATVSLKFKTTQAGLFKGQIFLKSQSILVRDKIDIHATAVQFSRYLVDSKGAQNCSFDFKNIYSGQQSVIKGHVINNSPKAMQFKSTLRKGYLVSSQQFALVQTPAEIGLQQSQKVMFMQPQFGAIQPFGQMQVRFICRTKVSYKDKVYTKTYALTSPEEQAAINSKKNSSDYKPQNLHQYSIMLKVQQDQPIIIQLKAITVCPQIKLEKDLFQFGDCYLKDIKQQHFVIQNKSQVSKVQFSFNKIPNFSVFPNILSLRPLQKVQIKLQFQPKAIGKFDVIQKLLINKIYELDLRLFGIAIHEPKTMKSMKKTEQIQDPKKIGPINTRKKVFSVAEKSFLSQLRKSTVQAQKSKLQLQNLVQNRQRFNIYLKDKRSDRLDKQKQQNVQKRWSLYQTKLKDLGPGRLQQHYDQQGNPVNPPIDYEFQSGMNETKMNRQQIALPNVTQRLFVTKHINDYEPLVQTGKKEKFSRHPTQPPKKLLPDSPVNYNHRREITSELTPGELTLVEVMSNVIQFGDVYIKSKETRHFWIRNLTKKAISVQLKFQAIQLKCSYSKPQILKSAEDAGFAVVFCKDTLNEFKGQGKYIINGIYEFQMTVTARSTPVQIQLSSNQLKFNFDESSLDFSAERQLKLYNPGNSSAFYKFLLAKDKLFIPKTLEGTLLSKQRIKVPITLNIPNPTVKKNQYTYTERLVLKVLDGTENTILCTYSNPDPKYTVKCQKFLSKSIICLGHNFEDSIDFKNSLKTSIVMHIEANNNLEVSPNKFKLSGEQSKKISIKFVAKIIGQFNISITIIPRGGQKKVIQSTITVVQPKISFSSEYINMGTLIVQGVLGSSKFTLTNNNQIPYPLIIDIRPKSICPQNPLSIQNVGLRLMDSQQTLQVIAPQKNKFTEHIGTEGENLVGQNVDEQQFQNSESEHEQIIEKNHEQYRKFRLVVKPDKVYNFELEFYPKQTGKYQVSIPMQVQNSIKIDNSPCIMCQAIKPQFIFEPSIIDFKRKIVTKPDRCYPKFMSVNIHNIDQDQVYWELDVSQILKEGIFQISQSRGKVLPKEKLQIKVSFNPYQVGQYYHLLPLFIHSKKISKPLKYVDVIMKGTASLPNIYFNKREVIMPVVPLGIQTYSSFKIINDGYQNCNLKHQFIDDVAGINVKVHFPQGPNIGITRQKLKVDLSWKFNKPMSFTLKLQFTDDMNRTFVIPVSGTTDNCIFTNYTYFLRNQGKFKIKAEASLQLVETNENAASSFSLKRKNSAQSLKSSATNNSVMSYLGVSPINQAILTNTLNYVLRYLNANLLTMPVHQFPDSLIQSDGTELFEIIAFISNKAANYSWKYSGGLKGIQKAKKLFQQYNQLVKLLKIQGAHLNHIRPQYLLSFTDLNLYLGSLPEQKSKYFMPSLLKINRSLYNYLSIQSWITLLYQIFKIYALNRVNPKNFKTHILNAPEIPKQCLQLSNFSSVHQNILFFWVQQAVNQVLLEDRRLTNFDKDFKDGIAIGALLRKYSNNQVLKKMKTICVNQQDFKINATILCEALKQIGLLNHVVPRDIYSPLQRQMLLLILNLYVYLPFYVPKQEPIVFRCILSQEVVRSIQLTNPSTKPVIYEAKYEGSEDFKFLGQTKIRLEPKQTYRFQVKFVSRISAQVRGRIMFINVKENSLTAAPLVFDLKSEITGKVSDRIWNISGVIYEQIQFNIDVSNKFTIAEIVDFVITHETQYIFEAPRLKGNKQQKPPLAIQDQLQTIYGKLDNVKIRKNGSVSLTLNYIPTSLYTTRTIIYFSNTIIGEFQHEIIGTVEPPSVSAQIRPPMTLTVDQIINWEYQLSAKNEMILRAKKAIQGIKKRKGTKQQKQVKKTSTQSLINEQYIVQINPNPYVSAKQTIWLNQRNNNTPNDHKNKEHDHKDKENDHKDKENDHKIKEAKSQTNNKQLIDLQNKIPFTIICKNPVFEYVNHVLVYNRSKTDVRRFIITFTIQPKPLRAILEMNVPARGQVTQNLPIVNNTDRDWNIKIVWQPDMAKNGNYFIVPSLYTTSFPVKKQSIGNFPITFKPKWTNKAQARLTMSNSLTLDHFQYEIIGNGQDPLAEDHIQIKCQAKQRIKKQIWVNNPYSQKPITLRVETDLLSCQCLKKLTIPSAGKQKFQFYVQPMLCGEYTGSITFYEQQGPQYLWYTISVVTNYPEPYKTIDLTSQLRSKMVQKLHLPYKQLNKNTYQVIINGGGLSGAEQVTLKPGQQNYYCLEYLPLEVGQQKGSVIFINNDAGQILFQFNLNCLPRLPVVINDIKSPLGVSAIVKVELQNPINKRVTLNVFNTNSQQFVLKEVVVKLQPYEKKTVEIQYVPASLEKIESGQVTFRSKEIGDWVYELSGTGLAPVPFEYKPVYNGIFEEHSDSVKFRNPFKYQIMIGIKLIPKSNKDLNVFKLLNMNKTKFTIQSFGVLQIPFSFIPSTCSRYYCDILLMISEKIFWTFPIIGITQINKGNYIASLSTPCRQSTSSFAQIQLEGVQNFKQNNQYAFMLQNIPTYYEKLIEKTLSVHLRKDKLNHAKDSLQLELNFKPMKPLKASFDLVITRKQGSRWRYKLSVQGTQPQPDDIIQIEANLLVTTTVSFKLTNWQKQSASYKAKFTSDSAHQFSVQPKQGTLAKYGSKGTAFYVSFTPVEYGKEKRGKLTIQTNDMYWSYILKGSLPKYIPPKTQVKRTRISSSIK